VLERARARARARSEAGKELQLHIYTIKMTKCITVNEVPDGSDDRGAAEEVTKE
jgi:hypothetical protein